VGVGVGFGFGFGKRKKEGRDRWMTMSGEFVDERLKEEVGVDGKMGREGRWVRCRLRGRDLSDLRIRVDLSTSLGRFRRRRRLLGGREEGRGEEG